MGKMMNKKEYLEWMQVIEIILGLLGFLLVAKYGNIGIAIGIFIMLWANNITKSIRNKKPSA